MLDLYCWLALRLPDAFAGREAVEAQRAALATLIDASVRGMGAPRRPRAAPPPPPPADDTAAALAEQRAEAEWLARRDAYHQGRRQRR